ncbi:hypothetical protein [Pedobacter sp. GR22-6]|uniref:hypothetical protein n=1 Tax=Pedobacter sp. GR22-6 TaxID=3127957 RepID=UPI00307E2CE6
MFEKLPPTEILNQIPKRNAPLKNLRKLPELDPAYLNFLAMHEGLEITPDLKLSSYEAALTENRVLALQSPKIAGTLWLIGRTGQGDEWFIDKNNGHILFFDHEQGEYANLSQFKDLGISFMEFLQMGFLYQELEILMDENDDQLNKAYIEAFQAAINSIHPELADLYPFSYF